MSELLNPLQPGTMLRANTYRIVRFIAAGGFGCTYEAEHVLLEKRIAIKEFFMQECCNRDAYTKRVTVGTQSNHELVDKYKRKFIGEAKALSCLEHEGIVRVSDVFEENGTAYFVMDYVDGQPLSGLCKNGPLPEKHALFYIRQVCEALAYVHDHNRLHLDLTPANIMVKSDGCIVLIDFGASKQYEPTTGKNNSSTLVHTPGYAPLEQMNRNVQQFFPATDIYALGATLYRLLTGRIPSTPDIRLNEEDNLTFPAGISAATRRAVERALEVRKKDRPQSVREFMALLDAAIQPAQAVAAKSSQPSASSQKQKNLANSTKQCIQPGQRNLSQPTQNKKEVGKNRSKSKASNLALDSYNGHDFVDLGLSVKWATCNVGANTPEEYGNYYAWGETSPKSSYDEDNCKTWECSMGDIGGDPEYDAARANWGSNWRLPTDAEFEELIDNCDYQWTTQNGVAGVRFTSKRNGNSIFFPAAGWRIVSFTDAAGERGNYWSSTPSFDGDTQFASGLYFDSGGSAYTDGDNRDFGRQIRPVFVLKPAPAKAKAAEAPKAGTIRTEEIVEDGNKPVRRRRKLWRWMVCLISVAAVIAGIVYVLKMPTELSLDDLTVSGSENEYDYVDLGLSVKWATCNLGASSPEEYGNYYTLGETIPIPKSGRRLPTKVECDELVNNCTRQWTTQNGVAGMLFTSKINGNSIFFPAAGWRSGSDFSTYLTDMSGEYWSSTPYESGTRQAYSLSFNWEGGAGTDCCYRSIGRPVRPVFVPKSSVVYEGRDKVYTIDGVRFKMIAVAGGTFTMGATSEQKSPYDNEKPTHTVTLSDYYIGETEVTQELWTAVMGDNPSRFTGNMQRPVENVSWNDCQTFIRKLNRLTGANFRLPTEAEWEYAARGGRNSRGYQYSGKRKLGDVAWYVDNSSGTTHPVKTKSRNELGIFDMSGNVYEWCQDWYGNYSSSSQTNPTGPST
ncbi:MAG: SUMF1/EgtB/PvdO family nonheme iron enzyme, partial [Alloprevotella sp.]